MNDQTRDRLRSWLRRESAPAAVVALLYLGLGVLWILVSDRAASLLIPDPAELALVQTYKGWGFVLCTSILLFFLVWGAFKLRTSHQVAEAEVNRFLSTLLKNVPGMAYRCRNDTDWTMEYVSEGVAPLTGYSAADFVEKHRITWAQLIEPDDRDRVWAEVQAALDRRGPFRLEYRIRTRADQPRWVWEQGRGVYDPEGELVALEGFVTDITARKRAEAQLRERSTEARPDRKMPGARPYRATQARDAASDR